MGVNYDRNITMKKNGLQIIWNKKFYNSPKQFKSSLMASSPGLVPGGRGMTKPGLSGNAFFVSIPGGSSLLELLNIESSLSVLAPVPDLFRERSSKVFG
jgi:hypothetical protein